MTPTVPWHSHFMDPRHLLLRWPQRVDVAQLNDIRSFKEFLQTLYPDVYFRSAYTELLLVFQKPIDNRASLLIAITDAYKFKSPVPTHRMRFKIPVCYDAEFALDLPFLSESLGLSPEKIIALHTKQIYTVFAIGFLPGFMYLGGLSEALHFQRKDQPRVEVPKGAVGIGGQQTGIYPQSSPGGWQLIGNCPLNLFNVEKNPPFFAEVGDEIQFIQVDKDHYRLIALEVEAGVYQFQKSKIK